jgi:aminoglycoside phosphotransferase (APT) family kinase protein
VEKKEIDINVALVERLIASQFPQWANLKISPVKNAGWDNRTFHLGDAMSVRLPSAEGYTPQAEKEQFWLPVLEPRLPLPIPKLMAKGVPDENFPWKWGIYRWIEGETADIKVIKDLNAFAKTLANFLQILQEIDTTGGPVAGQHSAFRGASLLIYAEETVTTIDKLKNVIDADLATSIWEDAISTQYKNLPVWFHGDVASGNLIVQEGELSAVIDFGCCGIGDPACDLTIAWTLLSGESRAIFRSELNTDDGTWARGRGWALWKALITFRDCIGTDQTEKASASKNVIDSIFDEYLK